MNVAPLIFLAAFFGLSCSWVGFVFAPQLQLGSLQQTNTIPLGTLYPVQRPGLAREGLSVYRANGCAYCHSQQVVQTGTVCDVMLTEAGTNQTNVLIALRKLTPLRSEAQDKDLLDTLPRPVLQNVSKQAADAAVKLLTASGAKASTWVVPVGPDIARGWGNRRTVAEDFLFDSPAMPGSQRVGPDLANVGVRLSDRKWHLLHLYAPRTVVKDSIMPPYRFLFEKRRIERARSPDALDLPTDPGYEIVPKTEAIALAAYLVSLRANEPLFSAPVTVAAAPTPPAGTNAAPGEASTNAIPTNTPSK
jgi:cbb3-type cytochrome oxidase cytochrome c subunit